MRPEYESSADERDHAQQQLTSATKNTYDTGKHLKDFADSKKPQPENTGDTPDSGKPDTPDSQNSESRNSQNSKAGDIQHGSENVSKNAADNGAKKAGEGTGKEAGKSAAGEAGKTAGKEAGKEVAKEGAKQGAKEGAKAAAASTGAGAVVAAGAEALDKAKDAVKGIGEQTKNAAKEQADKVNSQGNLVQHKKKAENMYEDNTFVKIVIGIIATIVAVMFLIAVILVSIIQSLIAPVTNLFNALQYGWELAGSAADDLGEDQSYEAIAEMYKGMFQDAFTKAFDEVSYNEVYQIALEQEYDLELTMESFSKNIFPYSFDGEETNVNFLELIAIMSMSDQYNIINFNYDRFKAMFEDIEFLRCLYDLKVERAEHLVIDEDVYDSEGNLIHKGTGEILDRIIYGEVTIGAYPLKKIFDYFGVDPNASNLNYPTLTNYQALSVISSNTKLEDGLINWGYDGISRLKDYTMYTGEITENGENIYADQMHEDIEVGNYNINNGVPVYAQSDPAWGSIKYGSKTISSLGCCLTSMSMISSYFTGEAITPKVMSNLLNKEFKGELVRDSIAKYYGFHQYDTSIPFSAAHSIGELNNGRLLIVHIKKGHLGHSPKYGHYVVITGVNTTGEEPYYTIADPAGGKVYELTVSEALYHLDYEWSYGY